MCLQDLPSVISSIIKGAFQTGPYIVKYGKVVGQWILQGTRKVGQFTLSGGKVVAVDAEVIAEDEG